MQMRGALSVLVRGTVKSSKWRLVLTKDQYSAHCSSSLWLRLYHKSSALGSLGRTSMPMTLLSSLNRLRNVSGGSWLGKKQWRRKDWEKMQERQRSWYAVWDWTSCRVQASFHAPSVALEWAATASSAIAASTGCTRNAVGSSAWQRTLTTDVHGVRELHCPWTADYRRKSWLDLTSWTNSILLLPRRHTLSSWKKFKDLLPVLSSHHLSFKTCGHLYSSWVQSRLLHASKSWPLTNSNLQRLQRNDRQ